jgi:hypothetical protein
MNQPAFPVAFKWGEELNQYNGMTLRDYFAAKAMQGMMTDPNLEMGCNTVATLSYKYADAMMEAREA